MPSVYKFVKKGDNTFKERLHIKAFKNQNDLGAFMCSKHNDFNQWRIDESNKFPQKSGIYAFAGGQWHNVKSLDPSILAHI